MPLGSLVIDLTLHLFGSLMEGYSHWIKIDLRHRLVLEMPISVFAAHQSGAPSASSPAAIPRQRG